MVPNLIYWDFASLNLYIEIKQEIMLKKICVILKSLFPIFIPSNEKSHAK